MKPATRLLCCALLTLLCLPVLTGCPMLGPALEDLPKITDTWPAYFYGADPNKQGILYPSAVMVAENGDAIVAGSSLSQRFIMRTDSQGQALWWRYVEAQGYTTALAETAEGNIKAVFSGYGQIETFTFDASGTPLQSETYQPGTDNTSYVARPTSDGGLIVGATHSPQDGLLGFYLAKLDAAGAVEWEKVYSDAAWTENNKIDVAECDGDFVFAGMTAYASEAPYSSYLILRVDSTGETRWSGIHTLDVATSLRAIRGTADGGAICAGPTISDFTPSDSCLLKLDNTGGESWFRQYDDDWESWQAEVAVTPQNDYFLVSGFAPTYVRRIAENGDVTWTYELEIPLSVASITPTADGGGMATGTYATDIAIIDGRVASIDYFLPMPVPMFLLPLTADGQVPGETS